MVQRMSVKLVLLIAVSVFMGTADHATAATDPMSVPSVQTQIAKFNQYRNTTFIPGMMTARAYMPKMKIQKPLLPQMTAKMLPVVRPVIIKNIQDSIVQPPPFNPGAPPLW
ncbi:hypothetical protein [Candidatus Electronema sp. PJ]|uniref:hypothetical protein n=1 Tax=Candidatus Electronema sp. PJ TaxID=3401572 RepID=UPI003AA87589